MVVELYKTLGLNHPNDQNANEIKKLLKEWL